jgi:hypothetical protein
LEIKKAEKKRAGIEPGCGGGSPCDGVDQGSAFKVVPQQGIKVAKKALKALGIDLLASRRSSR